MVLEFWLKCISSLVPFDLGFIFSPQKKLCDPLHNHKKLRYVSLQDDLDDNWFSQTEYQHQQRTRQQQAEQHHEDFQEFPSEKIKDC